MCFKVLPHQWTKAVRTRDLTHLYVKGSNVEGKLFSDFLVVWLVCVVGSVAVLPPVYLVFILGQHVRGSLSFSSVFMYLFTYFDMCIYFILYCGC